MHRSLFFSLVAILNLALVQGVDFLREQSLTRSPIEKILLGSAPNFFAAIAIAFLCMGVVAAGEKENSERALAPLLVCLSISGIGLCGWEFYQIGSGGLVFDISDLAATLAGVVVAAVGLLAFRRLEMVD